jgi:CRP/FNR family transcriptional regulator, anaerobic regulatory protein
MEELITLLRSFGPLSPKLEQYLRKKIKRFLFEPDAYLQNEGEVANLILYIEIGLVKSTTLIDGNKVVYWFMKEGNIVIAVESFLLRLPSEEWIQAIERTTCWGITWDDLEEAYRRFPRFERTGRLITSLYYCMDRHRDRSKHQRKAHDRYAYMMQTNPDLINRVNNDDMASYLNMKIRTYQKVRSEYANPGKKKPAKKKSAAKKKKPVDKKLPAKVKRVNRKK